ncbi:P1 family peptidase [Ruegeria halocynthiae]|uniref:DmpA family aminopeptidase n=1 Tax=Ruegeria halocynthiae TaxID=985054 RepID=UPI000564F2B4|nr:P1 family peptidase [Ruegeria halocynthiae]
MNDPYTRTPAGKLRAHGLGLRFDGSKGSNNSITDVDGVSVGYCTLIDGQGQLEVGTGPVRTGVTAILPRPVSRTREPVFAGLFSLNGNGEMTGSHIIEEVGKFSLPITITNTHSCGTARDATIQWAAQHFPDALEDDFALPVAAETYDGFLNDINGFHVKPEHVVEAIQSATTGPIEEGSVGGGTGMKCFDFKAGSGTASRRVGYGDETFVVGAFVQANFGERRNLTLLGRPLGAELEHPEMRRNTDDLSKSSIIVILATDAPFMPHQLKRLARRSTFGIGRVGGLAHHGSGDIFLAFSTANTQIAAGSQDELCSASFIPDERIDPFFDAVAQVVEEAIVNSMTVNSDVTGRDGNFVPALPHSKVREAFS